MTRSHTGNMSAKTLITEFRDLERQLAVYSSPAEIEDVLAAIEHDDHPDANLVRDILTSNLAGSYRAHRAQRAPLSA